MATSEIEKLILDLSSDEERDEFANVKMLELMERFERLYDSVKGTFADRDEEYAEAFELLIQETDKKIKSYLVSLEKETDKKVVLIQDTIDLLESKLSNSESSLKSSIKEQIKEAKQEINTITAQSTVKQKEVMRDILDNISESYKSNKNYESKFKEINKSFEDYRAEFNQRLASNRGGSMNRQVLVGGSNPLTRYTDYNLIAGSNVTITTANNDSKRRVDITFASSGSGGSGFQQPLSGALGQGTFTWTTAPNVIVVDGVPRQKTQSDGTVNWTGTATTVLSIWPAFDIFATA